jgi:O-antigen/teichoic acid export membrane protein
LSIRRALAFAYIEKYGTFLISLASTMVLSRLLAPEQIGVFSIGMAIVSLVGVIREFGLGTYLIQEPHLDSDRIRAAFTVNLAIGISLAAIVLLLAIPAGHFYGDPLVTKIIAIMSLAFVLIPFGAIPQALLTRELKFGTLAWIRLSSGVALAVASVAFAWYGMGAESLAWGSVVSSAVSTLASLSCRLHDMRPIAKRDDLLRVLKVGGGATAVSIVDEVMMALPEAALGRLQSMTAVGLFSRSRTMSQMAHQVLARAAGPVFLAAFSDLKRNGLPLGSGYLRATACIVAVGWAALGVLAIEAEPVVAVLFGANWTGVVTPLRWLCLGAAVSLLTSGAHHLLLADGALADVLKARAWALPGHMGCVVGGAMIGLDALAIALVISSVQSSMLLAWFVRRRLAISLRDQLLPALMSLPVVLSACAGAAVTLLLPVATYLGSSLLHIALGSMLATMLAVLALASGSHPLKSELSRAFRQARRRGL